MINHRRSEIEIIQEIISLSQQGLRKTEILYQANLSFSQLNHYLTYLLEKEILEEKSVETDSGSDYKLYQTTSKGLDLLEEINKTLFYLK